MIGPDLAFSGAAPDRNAALRGDPAALAEALRQGLVLPLWHGRPLTRAEGAEIAWLDPGHPVLRPGEPPVFLGHSGGRARFACDLSAWVPPGFVAETAERPFDQDMQPHPGLPPDHGFRELRSLLARLSAEDGALAATAKALTGWHASHRFCAACGVASLAEHGGWHRRCPSCGATHFPRTDPVVIMLVTRGERTLIGRSAGWPPGMHSCLAGFVEPGETLETAVRREVLEETGVRVGAVHYLASQPWPFPASLMLGFHAEAESEEITLDPQELEAARWISRAEMAQAIAGQHPELRPPRRGSIARALLEAWVDGRLS